MGSQDNPSTCGKQPESCELGVGMKGGLGRMLTDLGTC